MNRIVVGVRLFELFQQISLLACQFNGRFDHNAAHQVAGAVTANGLHTLAFQTEHTASLGFLGNLELDLAVQCRNFQFTAHRGKGEYNRDFTVQFITIAFEYPVRPDADFYIQVTRSCARHTRLALTRQANPVSAIDSGGNFHRECPGFAHPALAMTSGTGITDPLPCTAACRTGLLNRKNTLLHTHLAGAAAGTAGFFFTILGAAAVTGFALTQGGNLDLLRQAPYSLFQVKIQ